MVLTAETSSTIPSVCAERVGGAETATANASRDPAQTFRTISMTKSPVAACSPPLCLAAAAPDAPRGSQSHIRNSNVTSKFYGLSNPLGGAPEPRHFGFVSGAVDDDDLASPVSSSSAARLSFVRPAGRYIVHTCSPFSTATFSHSRNGGRTCAHNTRKRRP